MFNQIQNSITIVYKLLLAWMMSYLVIILVILDTAMACSGEIDPPVLNGTIGMFHSPVDHNQNDYW